jgi:ABC-type sugar transport system substrate-binding protein
MALAQKPYEMGIIASLIGLSYIKGVKDLPKKISAGFVIVTKENYNDRELEKWFYKYFRPEYTQNR